jgi:hypothetical protein
MKTILSLILPENSVFRYLKNGRKGIGFNGGVLVTRSADGVEVGVGALAAADVDDSVANGDTIATRLAVAVGTTPTITLPAITSEIREVWLVNTASGNCTLDTAGSVKILTATAEADTLVIATGKSAHLLSNGTRWYHVSNDA